MMFDVDSFLFGVVTCFLILLGIGYTKGKDQ